MMMGWCGTAGWTMMVGMVLVWVLVIAVVMWAIMRLTPRQPRSNEDVRTVLDRRLAAGEIDEAEFHSIMAAMGRDGSGEHRG